MNVIGQFHAPASLSHRKKAWYILYRRLDISQSEGGCFRTGENPMSLLGLKPWIFPPVAYTLCQLCCPVSKHSELVLFIYLCTYLFLLNWNLNSLFSIITHYSMEGLGFKPQLGARCFTPFQTGPKAHPASTKLYTNNVDTSTSSTTN
jgi:hypothetical protein